MSTSHGAIQTWKGKENTTRVTLFISNFRKAREKEENEKYLAFIREKQALAN